MNSSRRKIAAILEALGVPPSVRRPAPTPATPACESLEGRQLLAGNIGMGLSMAGMGLGIADVSGIRYGPGVMPASAPGSATTTTTATAAASPQLQADQMKLQTDTQTIQDQSLVTPAMTSAVTADIKAIKSAETTTPNPAFVTNLQNITKAFNAMPDGPTLGQSFMTEIYRNVVFLSEGVSASLINQLDNDDMAVMTATGITSAQEATLTADHAAINRDANVWISNPGSFNSTGTTTTLPGTTMMPAMTATPVTDYLTPSTGTMPGGMGELMAAGAGVLVAPQDGAGVSPMGGAGVSPMGMGGFGLWGMGGPTDTSASAADTTLMTDQATLKTDMDTLQGAIQTVQATSNVTQAMQAVVRTDLAAVMGAASSQPSSAAVATLKGRHQDRPEQQRRPDHRADHPGPGGPGRRLRERRRQRQARRQARCRPGRRRHRLGDHARRGGRHLRRHHDREGRPGQGPGRHHGAPAHHDDHDHDHQRGRNDHDRPRDTPGPGLPADEPPRLPGLNLNSPKSFRPIDPGRIQGRSAFCCFVRL